MNPEWLKSLRRKSFSFQLHEKARKVLADRLREIDEFEKRSRNAPPLVVGGPNCPCCRKFGINKGPSNE